MTDIDRGSRDYVAGYSDGKNDATGTPPEGEQGEPKPLKTLADIAALSAAQVNARWSEVQQVLEGVR